MFFNCHNSVVMLSCSKRVTHFDTTWPCNTFEMKTIQKTTRIDLSTIKLAISQALGPEKEKSYFKLISDFLNSRITKSELDNLIPKVIGKDNIYLHNKLILSIFSNACAAEPCSDSINSHLLYSQRHHQNLNSSTSVDSSTLKNIRNDGLILKLRDSPLSLVHTSSKKHRSSNLHERSTENLKRRKINETILVSNSTKKTNYESKFRIPPPSNLNHNKLRNEYEDSSIISLKASAKQDSQAYRNGFLHHSDSFHHHNESKNVNDEEDKVENVNASLSIDSEDMSLEIGDWSFLKPSQTHFQSYESIHAKEANMQRRWMTVRGKARQKLCISMKEEEDLEEINELKRIEKWESSPILPPLGVSFSSCSETSKKLHPHTASSTPSFPSRSNFNYPSDHCTVSGKLPLTEGLHRRMNHIACMDYAMENVSENAVSALQAALQIYLKQVVKSCSDTVKIKHRKEELLKRPYEDAVENPPSSSSVPSSFSPPPPPPPSPAFLQKERVPVKGLWPHDCTDSLLLNPAKKESCDKELRDQECPNQSQNQSQNQSRIQVVDEGNDGARITKHDLMLTMERNPRLLGENAEFHLERISMLL